MARRLFSLLAFIFGAPLGCGVSVVVLYITLLFFAIQQLPAWAQGPAAAWFFDDPQETYGSLSGSAAPFGGIPDGGYTGPESFQCLLPPLYGYLTDPYGVARPGGWVHHGIDYGTYHQSVDVRTPFGGQVVFAGWQGAYGNLVVLENAGYRIYLAHNSSLLVEVGQLVSAGAVVASSGETGNASGIHVHFEVRFWTGDSWTAVDPTGVLLPGQADNCDWYGLAVPLP